MQTLELLLDDVTDRAVRAQWQRLSEAGLPSQADHTGPSNAPHVTVHARPEVSEDAEVRWRALAARLPLDLVLGHLMTFRARRGLVLVRPVTVSSELLALHRDAADAAGPGGSPLTEPGRWVPHVTLAHELTVPQVARALAALAELDGGGAECRAVTLRRWDPGTRRTWHL